MFHPFTMICFLLLQQCVDDFFYRYTISENIFFEFEKIISEHLVQVRFSPLMTLPTTVKITAQDFETKLAWSALPGSIISVPAGQAMNHLFFFPKDVSSQGFSEDCWCISYHAYQLASFHTYCFNTHPFNTYRFNTYPFNTHPVPFNTYPFNTYASAGIASFCLCHLNARYISPRLFQCHSYYLPRSEAV